MSWKKMIGAILVMLPLVTRAAAKEISLDAALDRFESTEAQSVVEDLWAHQRRLVNARFASSKERPQFGEDSLIKVEWYLRLGPARSPITLDDLGKVRDTALMDEVLWALLNEAVMGDVFGSENDWPSIRAALADFLSTHSQRKALLETPHAAWWAWIQDLPYKGKIPWELSSLRQLLEARDFPDPLKKAQAYCAVSKGLSEESRSTGISIARELRAHLPEETLKQRQILREVFARKTPCRRLFSDLAEVFDERQDFQLAAEQRSYALLQKLESGEKLAASELREIARYSFEAADWRKAYDFYSKAREEGSQELDVRVREIVSGTRVGADRYKDVAETSKNFEDALQEAFQSIYRDELLRSYAVYLESHKNAVGALEVWNWNYQYATAKPQRIEGLEKILALEGQAIDQGPTGIDTKTSALRWLDLLDALRKLAPSSLVYAQQSRLAEARIRRLGLLGEAEIRASLDESLKGVRP
ncbi:MAG: hypothetical protein ABIR96_02310 [Bdellovibrionota bacterium]